MKCKAIAIKQANLPGALPLEATEVALTQEEDLLQTAKANFLARASNYGKITTQFVNNFAFVPMAVILTSSYTASYSLSDRRRAVAKLLHVGDNTLPDTTVATDSLARCFAAGACSNVPAAASIELVSPRGQMHEAPGAPGTHVGYCTSLWKIAVFGCSTSLCLAALQWSWPAYVLQPCCTCNLLNPGAFRMGCRGFRCGHIVCIVLFLQRRQQPFDRETLLRTLLRSR